MFELTESALVGASTATVWSDVTDASHLRQWIWPERFETEAVVELHELGRWEARSDVAGIAVTARIVALTPGRSLRLEWRWEGEPHATDAEITLEKAADASTRVIVRHSGFTDAAERENHVEGWSNCLQRLVDRHAAPRPAPDVPPPRYTA